MTEMNESEVHAQLAGVLPAQYVLLEALVRHDAIGYHQLRETLADALETLTASGRASRPTLQPLRRLLASLDELHKPADPTESRPRLDWLQVLDHCGAG